MLLYGLLAATFLHFVAANCPPNYNYVSSFDMCYLSVTDKLTYEKAQDYCHWNYGYLVTVSNGFLNSYLSSIITAKTFIGYQNDGFSFYWDSGIKSPYTNWAPGQGESPFSGSTYAYMKPGSSDWYQDHTGGEPAGFICEAKPIQSPAPKTCDEKVTCKSDYTLFGGNCKCYKMDPTPRIFTDAESFCQNDGGHIVKIDTPELNAFFLDLSEVERSLANYPWIGLYCPFSSTSACTWADQTTVAGYSNYKTNSNPNEGSAFWMVRDTQGFVFNGQWQTEKGLFMRPVICQQEAIHMSAVMKITNVVNK